MNNIRIQVDMFPMISYLLQYNHVPMISRIVIHNDNDTILQASQLMIHCDCDVLQPMMIDIPQMNAKSGYQCNQLHVVFDEQKLELYTEAIQTQLHFHLKQNDEVLVEHQVSIRILPNDHWIGLSMMPELICSFITPNQSLIHELIVKASEELVKICGSNVFSGYLSQDENYVLAQIQAIYQAVWKHHIIYTISNVSYENYGQRVRLPKDVLRMNSGNCIEVSCLFASLLEAIHLHPVIVFIKGHAYVGCWLKEETFSECVIDDLATVENYSANGIHDIILFEGLEATREQFVSFQQAINQGQKMLHEQFIMLVDVKRSRGSGIRPFNEMNEIQDTNVLAQRDKEIKDQQVQVDIKEYLASQPQKEFTRIQTWERKLLDMSLRNPLISVRTNKSAIQLMVSDLHLIEDALDDGKEFQVLPAPEDLILPSDYQGLYDISKASQYTTLMQSEFKSKRFRTLLNAQKTEEALKHLYRASRTSIEENGTNTLYLALGFLKWYENDISEKARYAPLILIPIEIIRKSIKTGYVIRERDEDVLFNETLLELLKQDFKLEINGLSSLPLDEHGVDLNLVFQIVRQAIKGQKRWNVLELGLIGLFSFKQFVMWNDLRNRSDDLAKNHVVKSLMDGSLSWEVKDVLADVKYDYDYKPIDMALPMDIDSSQLQALCLADKGQSFILHGPPGTGKSQTITNMIANALYHQKSVLFIAEKSAALNVVFKRLEKIGLGPFCLELHSDKARKRDVLSQLETTLELGQLQYPQEYTKKAEELYQLRLKLQKLMEDIHHPSAYGKSLYEYMNRLEELVELPNCDLFDYEQFSQMNDTILQDKMKLVHDYEIAARQINAYQHPLKDIEMIQYSLAIKETLSKQSEELLDLLEQLQSDELLYALLNECNLQELQAILQLIQCYETSSYKDKVLFEFDKMDQYLYAIQKWIPLSKKVKASYSVLKKVFKMEQEIPYESIAQAYQQASDSFVLFRGSNQKKVAKQLSAYAQPSMSIEKEKVLYYCEQLRNYHQLQKECNELAMQFSSTYGKWMDNEDTLDDVLKVQGQLKDAYHKCVAREEVKQYLLQASTMIHPLLQSFLEKAEEQSQYVTYRQPAYYMQGVMKVNVLLQMHIDSCREYVLYSDMRHQLEVNGLSLLVNGYESQEYDLSDLGLILEKAYVSFVVESLMSDKESIMKFTYASMMDVLDSYRQATKEFQQLTKEELVARLSSRIPTTMSLSNSSEIAILKRAIKSKGRAMSIRKLFDQIPNLLRRLTPCMLMSPMSVAQYIDPNYPKFDLVIFDEASQLPTSSAVGAIARGEHLIVVGDPKQMPPTSFFQSNNVDEEHLEKEDLESILDDCLALSMPQLYLSWHYRSEHESLITFSNMQFYENRLMTFPSIENQKSMVKFVEVKGTYRKGKNRVNLEEAKAIVGEIKERLFDEKRCHQSIGVVTFNITQQILIDDLLMEAFREDKEFEDRANALYEPIFIKNLENVQGDERDVILFSICYGPDEDGRVSMNFGPINRDGGERRLNVAVSRSRKEMVVFSTLLPHQIDLNRTRSRGAAELKSFLEYAMKGHVNQNGHQVKESKDTYVEKIADVLRQEGYGVNTFVGSSRFKVDIAIKDPEHPDRYLIGIMVDGLQYASALTTRDRSISQISVLKRLGWNVFELFILDWWEHRDDVLKRLMEVMDEIKNGHPTEAPIQKAEVFEFKKVETPVEEKQYPIYQKCILKKCRGGAEAAVLFESQAFIVNQMKQVIELEAPIWEDQIFARINEAWGITRLGPRLRSAYESALQKVPNKDNVTMSPYTKRIFYWGQIDPSQYSDFRVPTPEYRRGLDEIVYEEIINAAKEVLILQFSMSIDDLKREVAKLFGWQKVTVASTGILDHAIEMMLKKNIAMIENDKIQLKVES